MNYYIVAILTAKSSINGVDNLVLICNNDQEKQCGIRKVITSSFPYYKIIVDSLLAQNADVVWKTDICTSYILSNPIFLGEGNIEMKSIPQLKTLTSNSVEVLEYNSVLSLLINGSFEKSWEKDFLRDYNIGSYSLKLFGNFIYGNISYNTNVINSSLQQMRTDFDEKFNNYIDALLYKQSKYIIKTKDCDIDGYSLIVYPEIAVQNRIECDSIEGFNLDDS